MPGRIDVLITLAMCFTLSSGATEAAPPVISFNITHSPVDGLREIVFFHEANWPEEYPYSEIRGVDTARGWFKNYAIITKDSISKQALVVYKSDQWQFLEPVSNAVLYTSPANDSSEHPADVAKWHQYQASRENGEGPIVRMTIRRSTTNDLVAEGRLMQAQMGLWGWVPKNKNYQFCTGELPEKNNKRVRDNQPLIEAHTTVTSPRRKQPRQKPDLSNDDKMFLDEMLRIHDLNSLLGCLPDDVKQRKAIVDLKTVDGLEELFREPARRPARRRETDFTECPEDVLSSTGATVHPATRVLPMNKRRFRRMMNANTQLVCTYIRQKWASDPLFGAASRQA